MSKSPKNATFFDFGIPIAYFGNPLPGEIGEIATRLSGGSGELKLSS